MISLYLIRGTLRMTRRFFRSKPRTKVLILGSFVALGILGRLMVPSDTETARVEQQWEQQERQQAQHWQHQPALPTGKVCTTTHKVVVKSPQHKGKSTGDNTVTTTNQQECK